MIERPIPKDIRQYDTHYIGPFTMRQAVCVAIAAAIGIPFLYYSKFYMPKNVSQLLGVLLMAVPISFSFKLYDIPFEKFVVIYIRNYFLAPAVRKYKTENIFYPAALLECDEDDANSEENNGKKSKKKKNKTNKVNYKKLEPEYRPIL